MSRITTRLWVLASSCLALLGCLAPPASIPPELPVAGNSQVMVGVVASGGELWKRPGDPYEGRGGTCWDEGAGTNFAAKGCTRDVTIWRLRNYGRLSLGGIGYLGRTPGLGGVARVRLVDRPGHVLALGGSLGFGGLSSDLGYGLRATDYLWLHAKAEIATTSEARPIAHGSLGLTVLPVPWIGLVADGNASYFRVHNTNYDEDEDEDASMNKANLAPATFYGLRGSIGVVFMLDPPKPPRRPKEVR